MHEYLQLFIIPTSRLYICQIIIIKHGTNKVPVQPVTSRKAQLSSQQGSKVPLYLQKKVKTNILGSQNKIREKTYNVSQWV